MYDTIASWMMTGGPFDEHHVDTRSRARHAAVHGASSRRPIDRPDGLLARVARVVRPAPARPDLTDCCVAA